MIRVAAQPEPANFDQDVRAPGLLALARLAETHGSIESIPAAALPPHWQKCLNQLHDAYAGICAYMCHRIPRTTGARTADHYVPKSMAAADAYEWSNYRLACSRMNARNHVAADVLDPFEIDDGWFWLKFYGFQVRPARGLDPQLRERVQHSIDRLRLNDHDCRRDRSDVFRHYQETQSFSWLLSEAPFIAREVERQGLRCHPDR